MMRHGASVTHCVDVLTREEIQGGTRWRPRTVGLHTAEDNPVDGNVSISTHPDAYPLGPPHVPCSYPVGVVEGWGRAMYRMTSRSLPGGVTLVNPAPRNVAGEPM